MSIKTRIERLEQLKNKRGVLFVTVPCGADEATQKELVEQKYGVTDDDDLIVYVMKFSSPP